MPRVIVKYKVKSDRSEENIEYINQVFKALQKTSPEGLRYASFVLEDGLSFIHIASIETEDGSNPLASLPEFQAFVTDIASRCEEPPLPFAADLLGSYRVFN